MQSRASESAFWMQAAGQQATRAQEANERAAVQRLDRVRDDQARRMDALHAQAEASELQVSHLLST